MRCAHTFVEIVQCQTKGKIDKSVCTVEADLAENGQKRQIFDARFKNDAKNDALIPINIDVHRRDNRDDHDV